MAINKTLFRKIRNKILRVPESYDQGTWGKKAKTPCRTKECIGGHALLEAGFCTPKELLDLEYTDRETGELLFLDVQEEAARLLGISYNDADTLFDAKGEGWKEPYETRFKKAKTKEQRARVTADYINEIIRTGKVL